MTPDKDQAFENAKQFLHHMDHGKGYDLCEPYCIEGGATFDCQCEALKDMTTVKEYAEWLEGLGKTCLPGNSIDLHSVSMDDNMMVTYVGTFHATHSAEGGPVSPPTQQAMHTDYVYLVKLRDEDGKVESVKKIWNDGYAMKQVGWA